jgi:hypothetical protein
MKRIRWFVIGLTLSVPTATLAVSGSLDTPTFPKEIALPVYKLCQLPNKCDNMNLLPSALHPISPLKGPYVCYCGSGAPTLVWAISDLNQIDKSDLGKRVVPLNADSSISGTLVKDLLVGDPQIADRLVNNTFKYITLQSAVGAKIIKTAWLQQSMR